MENEDENFKTIEELNNERKQKKKQIITESGKKTKQENIKKAQAQRKINIEKRKNEYKAENINNKIKNIISDDSESINNDVSDDENNNENNNKQNNNKKQNNKLIDKQNNNDVDKQINNNNLQMLTQQFNLFGKNLEHVNNRIEKLYTMKKTKQSYKGNQPIIVNKIDKKTLNNDDKLMNDVRNKILNSGN